MKAKYDKSVNLLHLHIKVDYVNTSRRGDMESYVIVLLGIAVGVLVVAAIILALFCRHKYYTHHKHTHSNSYKDLQENLEFPPPEVLHDFEPVDFGTVTGSVAILSAYPYPDMENMDFPPPEEPPAFDALDEVSIAGSVAIMPSYPQPDPVDFPSMPAQMPTLTEPIQHPGRAYNYHNTLDQRYQIHPPLSSSNNIQRPPPPPPEPSNYAKGYRYRLPQRFQAHRVASLRYKRKVTAAKTSRRAQGYQYKLPQRFHVYRPDTPPTLRFQRRRMTYSSSPLRPSRRHRGGRGRRRRIDEDLPYPRRVPNRHYY